MNISSLIYGSESNFSDIPIMNYTPLRNPEALQESEITDFQISVISATVAIMVDLRTSLQLWDLGIAGLLVLRGARDVRVTYPKGREGLDLIASRVGEVNISKTSDGESHLLSISPMSPAFNSIESEFKTAQFMLLDSSTFSRESAPPSFLESSTLEILKRIPRIEMDYTVVARDSI